MKRLIISLISIIVTLTAFSQGGTKNIDTNSICLTKTQAKEVSKDLLRKDSLEAENKLLWKNSDILTNQMRMKDALLMNRDSLLEIKNNLLVSKDDIISIKDNQLSLQKGDIEKLQKDLKKQKNKNLFSNLTAGTIITGLIVLLAIN